MGRTVLTNKKLEEQMKKLTNEMNLFDEAISFGADLISVKASNILLDNIQSRYDAYEIKVKGLNSKGERDPGLHHDHQDHSHYAYREKLEEGYYEITVEGPSVIYDEFGTGTEGANSPHPLHDYYPLNAYNSGASIQTNRNGDKYWVYWADDIDRYVTSHGVPAGCFIYDSMMFLADNVEDNILMDAGYQIMKKMGGKK